MWEEESMQRSEGGRAEGAVREAGVGGWGWRRGRTVGWVRAVGEGMQTDVRWARWEKRGRWGRREGCGWGERERDWS